MFYLVKVLIGRAVASLDRPFDYYTLDSTIRQGMRVLVSFGHSSKTVGFVLVDPTPIEQDIEEYQKENNRKLAQILEKVDQNPLLSSSLLELAKKMARFYSTDLIRVLDCFLPPSLKPKDSALEKSQGRFVDYVKRTAEDIKEALGRNEEKLLEEIERLPEGKKRSQITARKALSTLLEKGYLEVVQVPVSHIPELVARGLSDFSLTESQTKCYQEILSSDKNVILLQGVTGSGKTEIYMKLAKKELEEGKGVLILIPEIALTDQTSSRFYAFFKDTIAILNSSLSDSRRYEEYQRIASGECKIVLGTRSAIFAPVSNLGLIIIDEEHSPSYKQDKAPYYDAITVAKMRLEQEHAKLVLGSATPRIIDKARAVKGVYQDVLLTTRYAKNQEREIKLIDMNESGVLKPEKSALISTELFSEIEKTISRKEQAMVLINRRGYAPMFLCRSCHKTSVCPNCNIPLNYHKRENELRCHHCGYKIHAGDYVCSCGGKDFLSLGYGTERIYEDLMAFFPTAKVLRLDSDITGNERRHQILEDFSLGEADVLVGTQVIAKGHDFPNVTLAAMLDADSSLRIPSYLANEECFDLISQFVGRAGRGEKKGRVLIQTYCPKNEVISLAAKQDYENFFAKEMEERRLSQYPPYVFLTLLVVKGMDQGETEEASARLRDMLLEEVGKRRINIYGPSSPYIPYINGRYYRNILLKYKSQDECIELLSCLKTFRLANRNVEVLVDVDPGTEGI